MRNNNINSSKRKIITTFIFILFIFIFLTQLHAAKIQCVWTGIKKIIAVGDIHGAYEAFVKILKINKLIDEELHWIGGKTHLVQTGDILDRGPDAKKVFDMLMRLEKEAEEAGGKVHVLLGNHEEMNITGIAFDYVGYVTSDQFTSFLPDKYREKKEKEFRKTIAEKALNQTDPDLSSDNNLRPYWEELISEDIGAQKIYINNFNDNYGKWLLKKNAVIKINDVIFAHGGISKKFSTWKLEGINDMLRTELTYMRRARKNPPRSRMPFELRIVYKSKGPLWYRGLALMDDGFKEEKEEVDKILQNLGAKYMVIAHTPQVGSRIISDEYLSRFQGRIWIIDTGISESYGGFLSALIIENGKFTLWGEVDEK